MKDNRVISPCCIYCILNIVTNERYVGSTTNFSDRKGSHLYDMRHHKAKNSELQKAFDNYGEESLKFFKLEDVPTFDRNYLIEREQVWIDKYKPEYNLNPVAGNFFNTKAYSEESRQKRIAKLVGRKQSPEHVKARMDTMKRNGKQKLKIVTEEQKRHLSEINMGEKNPNFGKHRTEGTKIKSSRSMSKIKYTFIDPTGKIIEFLNLSKNSEKFLGFPAYSARRLISGAKLEYQGWTFVSAEKIAPSP